MVSTQGLGLLPLKHKRTSDINAEIKNVLTVNHGCSLAAKRFAISEIY